MFKFLRFLKGDKGETIVETQRQSFERLVAELNDAVDALPEKPAVTIDPATGHVSFALPEQFPDEALALPAPAPEETEEEAAAQTDEEAANEAPKAANDEAAPEASEEKKAS